MNYGTIVTLEDLVEILTNKMKSDDTVEIHASNERDVFHLIVRENPELVSRIKNEIDLEAKENACMKSNFICKGCDFEYPCFQEDMLKPQNNERRVKPWHIVLFACILIFALIGESLINWLLNWGGN